MIIMTNFDSIIGMGNIKLKFGGYRIEVTNQTTFGDIMDELPQLAEHLIDNRGKKSSLMKAAEYFGIPVSYAEEVWQNVKAEYRLYA